MSTIHEMLRRVKTIDLQTIGIGIVVDSKNEIVDKNKAQLMDFGIDKNEKKLKPYSNPAYARRKNTRNPFPGLGTPDLYNSGAFQRGFTLRILGKNSFEIFSTDDKNGLLKEKYGSAIFGLTKDSKEEFATEVMQPQLVREVKRILKL